MANEILWLNKSKNQNITIRVSKRKIYDSYYFRLISVEKLSISFLIYWEKISWFSFWFSTYNLLINYWFFSKNPWFLKSRFGNPDLYDWWIYIWRNDKISLLYFHRFNFGNWSGMVQHIFIDSFFFL